MLYTMHDFEYIEMRRPPAPRLAPFRAPIRTKQAHVLLYCVVLCCIIAVMLRRLILYGFTSSYHAALRYFILNYRRDGDSLPSPARRRG